MCGCNKQHNHPQTYVQGRCPPRVCAQPLFDVTPDIKCRPIKVPCGCDLPHEDKHSHKHWKKAEKKRLKEEKHAHKHHDKHDDKHGCGCVELKQCYAHFDRPAANSLPYPRHLNLVQ